MGLYIGNTRYKPMVGSSSASFLVLPYDAEIEYLESTGTQYINTGIYLHETNAVDYTVQFKVLMRSTTVSFGVIFNAMLESSGYPGEVLRREGYAVSYVGGGSGTIVCGQFDSIITDTVGITATLSRTHNIPTTLFAGLKADLTPWRYANLVMYYLRITKSGVLVRDYIPVRVGQVGYLYDRVSGELFGNEGTGDFVLGPDV